MTIDRAPQNAAEYLERFHANQRLSGFGFDTTQHMPCPFCAAPDFLVFKILEVEYALSCGARCGECDRSMKAVFKKISGSVSFEVVQTSGSDPPEWVQPRMRRDPRV